ncbi:hypothetical protein V8J82_19110 [Gymnodinialimonas sp. 2305UL16-5]|uniref:hypothetical protein n=1 Tax=Gymnodinialimonas mytili TaxID=3126503 RepID=UPI0030B46585
MTKSTPTPSSMTQDRLLREAGIRASHLLKAARAGDPAALEKLDGVTKRRRALDVAAHDIAGTSYASLRVGAGVAQPEQFFTPKMSAFWNHWFAHYVEAAAHRAANGGVLLPYKTQFVVVELHFLRALGLDPDDPDWRRIGFDWVRPRDAQAFVRLNASLYRVTASAAEVSDAV